MTIYIQLSCFLSCLSSETGGREHDFGYTFEVFLTLGTHMSENLANGFEVGQISAMRVCPSLVEFMVFSDLGI